MRDRAEQAQAFLAFATAEISSTLDFDATLRRIAEIAVPRLADWCAVHILVDEQMIRRLAFAHHDPAVVEQIAARPQQYTLDSNATHLAPHVLKTGTAEYYNQVPDGFLDESARDEAHRDILRALGLDAYMCIPLRARGRTFGAVTFAMSGSGRSYSADDYELALELVRRAGLAADNAFLYSESQAAETRFKIVAEASSELITSLDYETRLERLAQLTVPRFSDWCAINLIAPDGSIRPATVAHVNPDKLEIIQKRILERPLVPDALTGTPSVIRTGKPEWLLDATRTPNQLADAEMWSEHGIQGQVCSYIIVPLAARGRVLGAISFVQAESQRHFTLQDLVTAEEIARRAAIALDNAALFREKESLARELEERVEQRTFELSEAYRELSREVVDRTRAEETMRSLLRISSKLNSTLDVETSLDLLIREALRVVNGLSGFAGLRTRLGMQMRKFHANDKSYAVDHTWAPGVGIPGWVLEHRTPYVTNDAQNDPLILHELPFNREVKRVICTPIFDARDQVFGFFEIRDKTDGAVFTRVDVDFLMALSPVASIAIQNAQAYQRITDAEREVQDSYAQLRALAARLQTIREEERTDVARELHDELGQALTALKMDLALLISTLPKRNRLLLERARAMTAQIDTTIKTVRRLSSQLRPGMLDDLGLGPSVEWYAQEFQTRTGIEVETRILQDELPLSLAQATALFRIFQETLTNVARHANATRVTAKLEVRGSDLVLEITDNGQGFDPGGVRAKRSLGLLGMRERAENVQARLDIQSQPGRGTIISVAVPLQAIEQDLMSVSGR